MNEPISLTAFNSLPQAVKTWIKELGWKRENIASYHIQHSMPKVVTLMNMQQEKQTAQFVILSSGKWKKKVEK